MAVDILAKDSLAHPSLDSHAVFVADRLPHALVAKVADGTSSKARLGSPIARLACHFFYFASAISCSSVQRGSLIELADFIGVSSHVGRFAGVPR